MSATTRALVQIAVRRRFSVVVLASLSVGCLFVARGMAALIVGQLASLTIPDWGEARIPTRAGEGPSRAGNTSIVDLLDGQEGVADLETGVGPDENLGGYGTVESIQDETTGGCPPSAVEAMLVGTMVDDRGIWSYGIVQDWSANRTTMVRTGMAIAGARVLAVERHRLRLLNHGREECLAPNQEPTGGGVTPATSLRRPQPGVTAEPASTDREANSVGQAPNLNAGFARRGRYEYEIDRSALEVVLRDSELMSRHAPTLVQHLTSDGPSGIRISGLPGDSFFRDLGLRPGDVLREVNGRPLTSIQRGLDLVSALRDEPRVELELQRRGRTITLVFTVR